LRPERFDCGQWVSAGLETHWLLRASNSLTQRSPSGFRVIFGPD
jgi:hypothetical protein